MVESSDEPSLVDRFRSWVKTHASTSIPSSAGNNPTLPLDELSPHHVTAASNQPDTAKNGGHCTPAENISNRIGEDNITPAVPSNVSSPSAEEGHGEESSTIEPGTEPNVAIRFYRTFREILLSSYMNLLLVFVPIGIALNFTNVSPTVVFAMNAIAIIPLAGLLTHATESVASRMGDTVGALMNVTFGNAVELIIFIALVKNEIRIVQASLVGSILANLLLILGMCFLFGGLRFREQIYNSTVTQMSACLLSLSVMSLLLPTAFHASFTNNDVADKAVLQVSRGSSVILLLVYVLYLLFQLKSHAYMYESTPQHVIDEESHPGVLADMLNSSSSSDSSSSSSSSDSDTSSKSNTTATKRLKRAWRGRRRRKSSASSKDALSMPSAIRTPSVGTHNPTSEDQSMTIPETRADQHRGLGRALGLITSGDEADTEGEHGIKGVTPRETTINFRDFENEKGLVKSRSLESKSRKKSRKKHPKSRREEKIPELSEKKTSSSFDGADSLPEEGTVETISPSTENAVKLPFNIRGMTVRPTMPKMLSSTVFSNANPTGLPISGPPVPPFIPRGSYGLRRTSSLPDRLHQTQSAPQSQPPRFIGPINASHVSLDSKDSRKAKKYLSRTSAVVLLLTSTALVAVCAEFLVSSINYLVDNTGVSEAFVGLIILPIVGNAAEHVTAVTVASKNKMDLALGVALGSSIQIALFVTPVIVLLGWILTKDMSLYFTLFETVSLFVSAFIVNFLVLDGRSNYLEGALLIAAYVIIAVAAFFYPDSSAQSVLGGAEDGAKKLNMLLKMP